VEDRTPEGLVPGGPSLYAARAALALGADVTLVTRLSANYDRTVLAGLDLKAVEAAAAPQYANSYDADGNRTQLLLNEGEPLTEDAMACDEKTDVFLLAPAYHEVAEWPFPCAKTRGISLQGLLRSKEGERVVPTADAWSAVAPFVAKGVFAFLSAEDTRDAAGLARKLATEGMPVFVTHGHHGADYFAPDGTERHWDPIPADAVDPTGAGDCFATAFIVRFAETNDLTEATRFALAAGSLAVEGAGIAEVPTRGAIEARLGRMAA
jgi:hypothetical protein